MAPPPRGFLRYRDGKSRNLCVRVDNSLSSLISGVNELSVNSSVILNELVEQEKPRGGQAREEESSDDEDDEDELKSDPQPPTKRSKT
uniref:Uncharacterized protein n=1 Tax=Oryzias melastigma TaxID=30732 RepID=A0A3B3E035_ORYME